MGLLGKSFASKFKTITKLAVSRIAILKNQHKVRSSYAQSDVAQLLNLGYQDHALRRVELWIEEQNMLDVLVMIENYCNFLRERAELLDKNKECPNELKEATSSLIFASSRCGEFPELHKIRDILTSKFGREFAAHAVELHKYNGVNSKMIQKLSSRRPDMEIRIKALKEIATEIGVTLYLEQDPILINENKLKVDQKQDELETRKWSKIDDPKHKEDTQDNPESVVRDEDLSDRNKERKRYKDTSAAAQEALESAAYGIETSLHSNHRAALGKVHPMVSSSSRPVEEVISKVNHSFDLTEFQEREIGTQFARAESHSSQNPGDDMKTSVNTESVSNEHEEEDTDTQGNMLDELGSAKSFLMDNYDNVESDAVAENENFNDDRTQHTYRALRWNPQRSQADPTVCSKERRPVMGSTGGTDFLKQIHTLHGHVDWKVMSVRTR